MSDFSAFVTRLHNDPQFRQQFANAPAQTLRQAGYDPTMFALPDKIDANALGQRLTRVFSNQEQVTISDEKAVAKLTPDQLWQQFGVIGLTSTEQNLVSSVADVSSDAVAIAVVIYGSAVAVSNSNVAVVTQGVPVWMKSIQQLQVLRSLAQQPRGSLQFSVAGPDGVAVHGLNADTVSAVLDRAK